MRIGTRSFVYDENYFLRYADSLSALMEIMANDDRGSDAANYVIDGMYSILAGYTSCIAHIDEVRRSDDLINKIGDKELKKFIFNMDSQCDHLYLVYHEALMNSKLNMAGLNEMFKSDLYVGLLEGLEDDEAIYERSEMIFILAAAVEDLLVHSIINKCGPLALSHEVIPMYINQIRNSNGTFSLQLIVFEVLEG